MLPGSNSDMQCGLLKPFQVMARAGMTGYESRIVTIPRRQQGVGIGNFCLGSSQMWLYGVLNLGVWE